MAISWASQQVNAGISWVKLYFSDGLYCVSYFIFLVNQGAAFLAVLEVKKSYA